MSSATTASSTDVDSDLDDVDMSALFKDNIEGETLRMGMTTL